MKLLIVIRMGGLNSSLLSFEDLDCWKACRDVRMFVLNIVKQFPQEEKYALSSGIRRSSRSTTENIADGFGRFYFQENIQFCRHSGCSLYEIIDQLITAYDEDYITQDEYKDGRILINKALCLLNGYIKYLRKAKKNEEANTKAPNSK